MSYKDGTEKNEFLNYTNLKTYIFIQPPDKKVELLWTFSIREEFLWTLYKYSIFSQKSTIVS